MLRSFRIARSLSRLETPHGWADPYPIYRKIQRLAPIVHFRDQWALSKHRHASLIKDRRFVIRTSPRAARDMRSRWLEVSDDFLLFLDPPDHTRVRALVTSAFTPKAVESWRQRIEEIVDELVTQLRRRESFDLIGDFAYPLPVKVICELLGLPPAHGDHFRRWSRAIAPAFGSGTPEVIAAASEAVENMVETLTVIVASRRRSPGEDLLSALIAASEDGERLTSDELLANVVLLFFGGHETTVNLIGNGMLALLRNRDQWEKLKDDTSLARSAVEEALRFDSPVQATSRRAAAEIEVDGQRIAAGSNVNFILGAANRDPDVFADPDTFDITRPNAAQHLAFSGGAHYCVGAQLARLEAEIAFTFLANVMPDVRLAAEPEWREMFILRGMKALPVKVGPR
jgi:pimeloyl-[acyl-carrier protein] synthase